MKEYRITENGLKLIEHYEGRYYKAYICPAGIPTIGIGHTRGVKLGDIATDEQINKWFYKDVMVCEKQINDLNLNINQNQFNALCSFVFNVGIDAFIKSTLLFKIKLPENKKEIRYQFSRWNKAEDSKGNLIELSGLTKRRNSEAEMYFTGNLILT